MYVQLQGWGKNISASAWTSATTTLTESQEGQRTLVPRCKLKKNEKDKFFKSFSLFFASRLRCSEPDSCMCQRTWMQPINFQPIQKK